MASAIGVVITQAARNPKTRRLTHHIPETRATAISHCPAIVIRMPHRNRAVRSVRSATRWYTVGVSRQITDSIEAISETP